MMNPRTSASLLAAFAKVKRAETYIHDLNTKINAFYKALLVPAMSMNSSPLFRERSFRQARSLPSV